MHYKHALPGVMLSTQILLVLHVSVLTFAKHKEQLMIKVLDKLNCWPDVCKDSREMRKWLQFILRRIRMCKRHGNWSNTDKWESSPQIINVNLMVAPEEFGVSPKLLGFVFWEPWMFAHNFKAIHPIVVEMFNPRPQWWNDTAQIKNQLIVICAICFSLNFII